MLLAEIHGKTVREAQTSEDLLTSAVFSHLRYLPPSIFWPELIAAARQLDSTSEYGKSLHAELKTLNIEIARYQVLDVAFWSAYDGYGEPDLILTFKGGGQKALLLLIEVKFRSRKSGTGEDDQLVRYLRLLDEPYSGLRKQIPDSLNYLIYLTWHDATSEIEDSLAIRSGSTIFSLQWQDIYAVANDLSHRAIQSASDLMPRLILGDVALFLRHRRLEYFRGFSQPDLAEGVSGLFYKPSFFRNRGLGADITVELGGWMNV
jgi:hypothetical protein